MKFKYVEESLQTGQYFFLWDRLTTRQNAQWPQAVAPRSSFTYVSVVIVVLVKIASGKAQDVLHPRNALLVKKNRCKSELLKQKTKNKQVTRLTFDALILATFSLTPTSYQQRARFFHQSHTAISPPFILFLNYYSSIFIISL